MSGEHIFVIRGSREGDYKEFICRAKSKYIINVKELDVGRQINV